MARMFANTHLQGTFSQYNHGPDMSWRNDVPPWFLPALSGVHFHAPHNKSLPRQLTCCTHYRVESSPSVVYAALELTARSADVDYSAEHFDKSARIKGACGVAPQPQRLRSCRHYSCRACRVVRTLSRGVSQGYRGCSLRHKPDRNLPAEALAGLDRRISVLEDWRAFLHNHAIFEHPSDPNNDRYIIPVHNEAGALGTDALHSHHDSLQPA